MPQPKPAESYRKNCTLCNTPRDVLVRCQIDAASEASTQVASTRPSTASSQDDNANSTNPTLKPGAWHFVCPGSCWRRVSGGIIDGDLKEGREGYRYGGMWKNKHAGVSAKVPRRLKGKLGRSGGGGKGRDGEGEGEGKVDKDESEDEEEKREEAA
jgi:hypothetical protein